MKRKLTELRGGREEEGVSNTLEELETTWVSARIRANPNSENRGLEDRKRTKKELADGRYGRQMNRNWVQIKQNLNN